MPARGEMVGDIYVRSHVDGRGMDRELAREVEKFDADKAGRKAGKGYGEGYEKAFGKERQKGYRKNIIEARANAKRLADVFEDDGFKRIERSIRETFTMRGVADKMVDDLKRTVERSGKGISFFHSTVDEDGNRIEADIDRFLGNLDRKYAQFRDQQERENERETIRRMEQHKRMLDGIGTLERQRRRQKREAEEREYALMVQQLEGEERLRQKADRDRERSLKEWEASFRRLEGALNRLQAGQANFGSDIEKSLKRTKEHVQDLQRSMDRIEFRDVDEANGFAVALNDIDRRLGRMNPRMLILNRNLDTMATRIGRMAGRGSRNDFLHVFGGITELMTRAGFGMVKLAANARNLGSVFGGGGGLGATLARLGPSIASGAVAMTVLALVMGTLVSLASGLVAALTALVGTLTLGVVGALAAVAGAILPVVAGIGVLAGGIMSMSNETKRALKASIKPFTDEMRILGRIGAGEIFRDAASQARILGTSLKNSGLRDLVRGIGKAINDVGKSWVAAISGPGFKKFNKEISKTLPDHIRVLGEITKNLFSGMGGLFLSMQPLVTRFLGWFEDLTGRFARFANSMEGQKSLQNFFKEAGDAAASVGDAIGSITKALGTLFLAGNDSGMTLFDDIAKQFDRLTNYLNNNPDAVSEWFENGVEVARNVGQAIMGIVEVIRALDTPQNRKMATALLDVITVAFETVAVLVQTIGAPIKTFFWVIAEGIGLVLNLVGGALKAIGKIPGMGWAKEAGENLQTAADAAQEFADGLWDINLHGDPKVDASQPKQEFTNLSNSFSGLAERMSQSLEMNVSPPKLDLAQTGRDIQSQLVAAMRGVGVEVDVDAKPGPGFKTTQQFTDTLAASLKNLPGVTPTTVTDRGTGKTVQSSFGKVGTELGKVKGTHNSKVKGKIEPSDYASRLASVARNLAASVGSFTSRLVGSVFNRSMTGRIANSYTVTSLAEDGKAEAVVPLERPLHLVDPAVREIAAFAQGKLKPEGGGGGGRVIDASGWTVVSNSEDPHAVATEALNELVGKLL